MDKGIKAKVGDSCNDDPNNRQQHVCAVCNTVKISSKKLTSMSKKELLSKETHIGLEPLRNSTRWSSIPNLSGSTKKKDWKECSFHSSEPESSKTGPWRFVRAAGNL